MGQNPSRGGKGGWGYFMIFTPLYIVAVIAGSGNATTKVASIAQLVKKKYKAVTPSSRNKQMIM